MRFKLIILLFFPILIHAIPGYFEPWGKDADLTYTPPQQTGEVIPRVIQNLASGNVGASDLQQAQPFAKQSMCKHMLDAANCKDEDADDANGQILNHPGYTSKHSLAVRVAEQIILFHQHVLSPVDGPRSHFRPSSSSYMMQSMQKHGFIMGFLMGCDRLMRENNDDWVYRKIETEGKLFKYDPIR